MAATGGGAGGRVTVTDLAWRLGRLEDDLKAGLQSIHRRLDDMNYVNPETLDTKLLIEAAYHREFERRITDLEEADKARQQESRDNRRLAWTSLAAPVIVAILVAIILAAMRL